MFSSDCPRHGRFSAAALRLAALLLCAGVMTSSPRALAAVTEYVVPGGPVIVLQNGRRIDGHVIGLDQTNLTLLAEDGSEVIVPRSTVDTLTFETVAGQTLVGELIGWTDGVYQIATETAAIKVYSVMPSRALAKAAPDRKATAATKPATVDETVEAGRGDPATIAAAAVDRNVEDAGDAEPAGLVESEDAVVSPAADLLIQVSVENSKENGPPVAFDIELSKPSENSVVLIYATIDGTAVNGQDYEANRGVVVIKAGERSARIEAPVIDDAEQEEQEYLQLFLTVDPKVATVETRQIIATIDDDDQT